MDSSQYSPWIDAVADPPDPRKARGTRYPWPLILTLIVAACVRGQRKGRAIGQWVEAHAEDLHASLRPTQRALPRTSPLRRARRTLEGRARAPRRTQFTQAVAPAASTDWQGQASDGKAVRGAPLQGEHVHLVSLVHQHPALVRRHGRVTGTSNAITAGPALRDGLAVHGTVPTLAAQLTQRTVAQHMLDPHGHSLMVVKANQPELYTDIALLCEPPYRPDPADAYQCSTYVTKAHGRLETRTLERSTALNDYVHWPGVGHVLRRTCERHVLNTGPQRCEVTYGLTSLPASVASAAQGERLWRGHWTIENQVHYVRDVTLGADAGHMHPGTAPPALAALRNGILTLLRLHGWTNSADALRQYGASVRRALTVIGVTPSRL